jgi:uncharacterized membrane protein
MQEEFDRNVEMEGAGPGIGAEGEDPEQTASGKRARNVGRNERAASVALGGLLLAYGGRRRNTALGAGLGLLGLALTGRGLTGRCAVYRAAGFDTAQRSIPQRLRAATRKARGTTGGVEIEQRLTVNRPCEKLYESWRRLERLPEIFDHIEAVHESTDGRSHWVAAGPFGAKVEWDAEITEDRPGECIAWRSLPGSVVENEGEVRFAPAPAGRGSEVTVRIAYRPLAGDTLAPLLRKLTNHQLREDLRHFKQWLEAGEVPTTDGQPHGRKRARGNGEDAPRKPRPGAHTMKKVRKAPEASAERSA